MVSDCGGSGGGGGGGHVLTSLRFSFLMGHGCTQKDVLDFSYKAVTFDKHVCN